ncbi:hypothetical protein V7138_21535 [Bacillus sp. JJ1533]|uniref:hypothetical protein n=1 Tax=Bacillus sp. JJ1533 TaxID=3122959 RepID=UPI002FFD91E7
MVIFIIIFIMLGFVLGYLLGFKFSIAYSVFLILVVGCFSNPSTDDFIERVVSPLADNQLLSGDKSAVGFGIVNMLNGGYEAGVDRSNYYLFSLYEISIPNIEGKYIGIAGTFRRFSDEGNTDKVAADPDDSQSIIYSSNINETNSKFSTNKTVQTTNETANNIKDSTSSNYQNDPLHQLKQDLDSFVIPYQSGISLNWEVEIVNDRLEATVKDISDEKLILFDTLHSENKTKILEDWGKQVFNSVSTTASHLNLPWYIYVGSTCGNYYPSSFSKEVLANFDGSCGLSFDILFMDSNFEKGTIFFEYDLVPY